MAVETSKGFGGSMSGGDEVGSEPRRAGRPPATGDSFYDLITSTPDAIAVHRRGTLVYANPSALRLFGYDSVERILGRSVFDFVPPAFRPLVADRILETSFHARIVGEVEEHLLHASGREIPVDVVAFPLDFAGEPATLVHIRDISKRKQLEVSLRAEDRLASLGLMAAGIAHEINNPLTSALAYLGLAEERLRALPPSPGIEEAYAMVASAHEGAARAATVARDVTVFSRDERDEPMPVDIHRILASCTTVVGVLLHGRARLVTDYGEVPHVFGRADRFGQIFLNLMLNAAQAMPPGDEASNTLTLVTSTLGDGSVAVDVRDTGCGIPPELLDTIFNPLFSTKREGTGLGLSITRDLASAEGARISLESAVGRGTSFRVILPAAPFGVETPSLPALPRARAKGNRILIVDDQPPLARSLQLLLADHHTAVATNVREAIEELRRAEPFDLILCDLRLAGGDDGIALYERVRTEWPGLEARMVFMSGDALTPRSRGFFDGVRNHHIEKPFGPETLLDVVDSVLGTAYPVAV